jgi:hypothetical protein
VVSEEVAEADDLATQLRAPFSHDADAAPRVAAAEARVVRKAEAAAARARREERLAEQVGGSVIDLVAIDRSS